MLSAHNDHFSVARILLSNRAINEDTSLTLPNAIASGKDNLVGESSESRPLSLRVSLSVADVE